LMALSRDQLPAVSHDPSQREGLNLEFAARWPLFAQARIFLPIADGAAANVASFQRDALTASLTVGTSAALRVAINRTSAASVPSGLWRYPISEELCVCGGALTDGGSIFGFMSRLFGITPDDVAAAAAMRPFAHGLVCQPFVSGERSTRWNPSATFALVLWTPPLPDAAVGRDVSDHTRRRPARRRGGGCAAPARHPQAPFVLLRTVADFCGWQRPRLLPHVAPNRRRRATDPPRVPANSGGSVRPRRCRLGPHLRPSIRAPPPSAGRRCRAGPVRCGRVRARAGAAGRNVCGALLFVDALWSLLN
jgi:hypothetical protein